MFITVFRGKSKYLLFVEGIVISCLSHLDYYFHFIMIFVDNCDLAFIIQSNGLGGYPLTEGGFAYMWAGAKATVGVKSGKYCFECKVHYVSYLHSYLSLIA